jgi:hypothetical protein
MAKNLKNHCFSRTLFAISVRRSQEPPSALSDSLSCSSSRAPSARKKRKKKRRKADALANRGLPTRTRCDARPGWAGWAGLAGCGGAARRRVGLVPADISGHFQRATAAVDATQRKIKAPANARVASQAVDANGALSQIRPNPRACKNRAGQAWPRDSHWEPLLAPN